MVWRNRLEDNKKEAPAALHSETCDIRGLLNKIGQEMKIEKPKGPAFEGRRMVVICMTPRSGSSYLGSVLKENGIAHTQEHFRIAGGFLERDAAALHEKTYEAYFRKKVENLTGASGFFAVKCDWPQYARGSL